MTWGWLVQDTQRAFECSLPEAQALVAVYLLAKKDEP